LPCGGATFQLNAGISGGGTPYTFAWTPSRGLSDTTLLNPVATVTTTTPNFVRGAVVPMTNIFRVLMAGGINIISAALIVGGVVFTLALLALSRTKETFGKDLDYIEEMESAA
jgi:hypothetical protein